MDRCGKYQHAVKNTTSVYWMIRNLHGRNGGEVESSAWLTGLASRVSLCVLVACSTSMMCHLCFTAQMGLTEDKKHPDVWIHVRMWTSTCLLQQFRFHDLILQINKRSLGSLKVTTDLCHWCCCLYVCVVYAHVCTGVHAHGEAGGGCRVAYSIALHCIALRQGSLVELGACHFNKTGSQQAPGSLLVSGLHSAGVTGAHKATSRFFHDR